MTAPTPGFSAARGLLLPFPWRCTVQDLVDDAVSKGATVTVGGTRNKDHPTGLFYLPTVRPTCFSSFFTLLFVLVPAERVANLHGNIIAMGFKCGIRCCCSSQSFIRTTGRPRCLSAYSSLIDVFLLAFYQRLGGPRYESLTPSSQTPFVPFTQNQDLVSFVAPRMSPTETSNSLFAEWHQR